MAIIKSNDNHFLTIDEKMIVEQNKELRPVLQQPGLFNKQGVELTLEIGGPPSISAPGPH